MASRKTTLHTPRTSQLVSVMLYTAVVKSTSWRVCGVLSRSRGAETYDILLYCCRYSWNVGKSTKYHTPKIHQLLSLYGNILLCCCCIASSSPRHTHRHTAVHQRAHSSSSETPTSVLVHHTQVRSTNVCCRNHLFIEATTRTQPQQQQVIAEVYECLSVLSLRSSLGRTAVIVRRLVAGPPVQG